MNRGLVIKEGGVLHRIAAFSDTPSGGNPAGVWVGEQLPGGSSTDRTDHSDRPIDRPAHKPTDKK